MFRARLALVLIVTAAACNDAARLTAPPEADRTATLGAIVPAGGSIQAAIDAAAPGAVIKISPGTYHVTATSQVDATQMASATVVVPSGSASGMIQ